MLLLAVLQQVAIVQELLLRKADVNARDLKQETPLYKACMLGNPDVVECLLSAGADPSLQDISGKPPAQEFNTKVTSEARERVKALVGKVVEERAAARTALKVKQAADDEQFKRAQQGCCIIA
jgi:Ankyrin repeats (many copies)